tara:strand:- start:231 stop:1073 length:843 start_codon:yes stop_codon:yes gene_type:complete
MTTVIANDGRKVILFEKDSEESEVTVPTNQFFSGKIEDAYFTEATNSNIEIVYRGDDDELHIYGVEVDFDNPDFQALLQEVSVRQIEENTERRNLSTIKLFHKAVDDHVRKALKDDYESVLQQHKDKLDSIQNHMTMAARKFEDFLQKQMETFKVSGDKPEMEAMHKKMVEDYAALKKETQDWVNYPAVTESLFAEEVVDDVMRTKEIEGIIEEEKLHTAFIDYMMRTKDEDLFKLKLAIFELPEVKAIKDRELKADVRRANNKFDVISALRKCLESSSP